MMMNKVVRKVSPAVPAAARPMVPRRAPVLAQAAAPAAASLAGKPIEKLKRAPSPFNLFYKAKFAQARSDLKAKGKEGTLAECAKALREHWDKLPDAQKVPFVQQAEAVKAEFEKAKAAGLIAGAKPKPVDPAGPKPLTVYAAFVKSQFAGAKKANPGKSTAEIAKVIAGQWKALDQSKKDALKAQYNKDLAAYHARQEALGTAPAPKPAAAKPAPKAPAAAPKAAAPAPKAASAPPAAPKKGASPTPPAAAKPPAPPSRGATPPKRASPTK